MKFLKDFKAFAVQGNVMDLAVAVIIGAAFSAIIASFVDDIVTPLLLTPALDAINANDIEELAWGNVKYGAFLSAVIKFIVYALVLFIMVSGVKKMQKPEEAAPAEPSSTDQLLAEIRDELRRK